MDEISADGPMITRTFSVCGSLLSPYINNTNELRIIGWDGF